MDLPHIRYKQIHKTKGEKTMKTLQQRIQEKPNYEFHGIHLFNEYDIKDMVETTIPKATLKEKAQRWTQIIKEELMINSKLLPNEEEVFTWKNPYTQQYFQA